MAKPGTSGEQQFLLACLAAFVGQHIWFVTISEYIAVGGASLDLFNQSLLIGYLLLSFEEDVAIFFLIVVADTVVAAVQSTSIPS